MVLGLSRSAMGFFVFRSKIEMDKLAYKEQLKDPRWQKKRLEIMKRADFNRINKLFMGFL